MPSFEGKVKVGNKVLTLSTEAKSKEDARRRLSKRGQVLSVKKAGGFDMMPGMSVSDRYTFLVRLSSMLGSRVGTAEALRLIATTFSGAIRNASTKLLRKIEAGMDLPAAMEDDRKNFPLTTTAMIRAGMQGGESWKALRDAAQFEYELSTMRQGSLRGIYTAIGTFFMAVAMQVGTTEYAGPMVLDSGLLKAAGDGIDIGWIVKLADWCTVAMGIVAVIVAAMALLATVGRQIMPVGADWLILKIPFYRDLILARNNYVTLYKLGLLVGSGVRLEEAMRLTAESAGRGALQDDLSRAYKAIRDGKPWAIQMKTLHPTDKAALSCAVDRAEIARTLDVLATQYKDLYFQRIATFAPTLQMISALFMTIAGGVLFGETMLPMLQMAAKVSQ